MALVVPQLPDKHPKSIVAGPYADRPAPDAGLQHGADPRRPELGGKLAYHYGVRVADEATQAEGYR